MSADDKKFRDLVVVVQSDSFQDPVAPNSRESSLVVVHNLCTWFNLFFPVTKDAFREFKESKGTVVTPEFRKLLFAIDMVPVSTAACEQGFSAVNDICSPLRWLLTVGHISSCMHIQTSGPPPIIWKPEPYVKSWLAKDRRDATSLSGMARTGKLPSADKRPSVWKVAEWHCTVA